MDVSHDQIIVHLNSHGARSQYEHNFANQQFGNFTTNPIKNISKIGLLYASVPKIFDTIDQTNNKFTLSFSFRGDRIVREVQLPTVNYYSVFQGVSTVLDHGIERSAAAVDGIKSVDNMSHDGVNVCEMMMWAINQALAAQVGPVGNPVGLPDTNIRCVAYIIDGRFSFTFG